MIRRRSIWIGGLIGVVGALLIAWYFRSRTDREEAPVSSTVGVGKGAGAHDRADDASDKIRPVPSAGVRPVPRLPPAEPEQPPTTSYELMGNELVEQTVFPYEASTERVPEDIDPVSQPFVDAIHRYIHDDLKPILRDCWATIPGDGELEARHNFLIEDGVARASALEQRGSDIVVIVRSTLGPSDTARALDCLKRAAEGTSFAYVPRTPDGATTGTYLGHFQTWETVERSRRRVAEGAP